MITGTGLSHRDRKWIKDWALLFLALFLASHTAMLLSTYLNRRIMDWEIREIVRAEASRQRGLAMEEARRLLGEIGGKKR